MQTISFENHIPVKGMQLKTENQYLPTRRDRNKCRAIYTAVQEPDQNEVRTTAAGTTFER
ncbi:TPA: hypothetical protein ACIJ16_003614 [Klebsiella aerogenes]|uniref:hypothetical protein n=1 Tax=Klebsiella aerogenes TaxID=548 RepID=UPI000446F113|nr:hypothetical protein [Klebsiella aerogenes]EKZ9748028.1 hypothetical protein [Klebsiella aerogenes]EUL41307.1 hypothetical protein P851_01429 [Klebsiella aerogenes UCI 48]EUL49546.1 hypothetical protein P850_01432 [Klebsiella aerogenes UCI 47]HBR6879523.1 hypothetical protein [Klebsiella aerogenes]